MRKIFFLLPLLLIVLICDADLFAQESLIQIPHKIFSSLTEKALQQIPNDPIAVTPENYFTSGVHQMLTKTEDFKSITFPQDVKSGDTLIVLSDQTINGTYTQNGPIFIADNATLTIKNSYFTVLGDIYLLGHNAQLIIDSSTLYSPQQYFYQRTLGVTKNGKVSIHNSTLDYSGLSHNVFATDTAAIELFNVHKIGWATNGCSGYSRYTINNCDQAGEYIVTDFADLKFGNTKTILLWHHLPDTSVIDFSFPPPDSVHFYQFNKSIPGIDGVEYTIEVDTCTDVMWALMPTTGSDVIISNSALRAIGAWFEGNEPLNVNGLVNNSYYSGFTVPLSDRNLQLNNCSLSTWSLYPMKESVLNISGSIVGEVGAMGHSQVNGENFTVDGSGGYFWSSDTSITIAGFTNTACPVRSERNGILIFAYSSELNGFPSALGESVLIIMQSMVLQPPVFSDGAAAWYGFIEQPFNTYSDSTVAITGSAWIEKGSASQLMEFRSFHLFFQEQGNAGWTEISCDSLNPVYDDTLGIWNTHGLSAGQYNLKLVIHDNWGNAAEGVKSVNMMPHFLDIIEGWEDNGITLYPNPAVDCLYIKFAEQGSHSGNVVIRDNLGKIVWQSGFAKEFNKEINIPLRNLTNGFYTLVLNFENKQLVKMISIFRP